MKTTWLLEKHTFEENFDRLKQAITDQGSRYEVCNYVPCGGGVNLDNPYSIARVPKGGMIYEHPPVFAYGSLEMVRHVQKSNLAVTTFCNLPQFQCSYYYPRFGSFLLQQEYAFIPYGELTRRKNWILANIGRLGQAFIRPNDGYKSFAGKLVGDEAWDLDIRLLGFYDVAPECMCVVAEPRNIIAEWRFVIGSDYPYDEKPQRIISASCYKQNGELIEKPSDSIADGVVSYVNDVLKTVDYRPDPFWTLDICRTLSGFHVLEVGSLSCAGLYGCDLNEVVRAINSYLEAEWDDMKPRER